MPPSDACPFCRRELPLTYHHLIPRTCHRNKWFQKHHTREQMSKGLNVCRDCHAAIHRFIPNEKELGRHFNTLEALRGHAGLAGFFQWIQGRQPTSRVRTAPPGGRKKR